MVRQNISSIGCPQDKTLPFTKVKYNIECNIEIWSATLGNFNHNGSWHERHFTHSTTVGAAWVEWRSEGWAVGPVMENEMLMFVRHISRSVVGKLFALYFKMKVLWQEQSSSLI